MLIRNEFEVAQPVDKVWRFFENIPQVAACLPRRAPPGFLQRRRRTLSRASPRRPVPSSERSVMEASCRRYVQDVEDLR